MHELDFWLIRCQFAASCCTVAKTVRSYLLYCCKGACPVMKRPVKVFYVLIYIVLQPDLFKDNPVWIERFILPAACVRVWPLLLCVFRSVFIFIFKLSFLWTFSISLCYLLSVSFLSFFFFCFVCFFFNLLRRRHPPRPPPSSRLLHPPQEGEGVEEQVVCLPAGHCDLELYTPQALYRHRPIEAPVSPSPSPGVKCTEN